MYRLRGAADLCTPIPTHHAIPFGCRLSGAAASVLQHFYLQLREHSQVADGTPVTARQLESLIRLAEARAKMELREEVTAQDAQASKGGGGGIERERRAGAEVAFGSALLTSQETQHVSQRSS